MKPFSHHLLIELKGCCRETLDNMQAIEAMMREAAVRSGVNIVTAAFHRFAPQGVTGVVVVEESHLSIHTWPEHGYAAVDFFTCGSSDPYAAHAYLKQELKATSAEVMHVKRGNEVIGASIAVFRHFTEDDEKR